MDSSNAAVEVIKVDMCLWMDCQTPVVESRKSVLSSWNDYADNHIRNVKGPVRDEDILAPLESEREARRRFMERYIKPTYSHSESCNLRLASYNPIFQSRLKCIISSQSLMGRKSIFKRYSQEITRRHSQVPSFILILSHYFFTSRMSNHKNHLFWSPGAQSYSWIGGFCFPSFLDGQLLGPKGISTRSIELLGCVASPPWSTSLSC